MSTFVWAECNEGEVDLGWGDCNDFYANHSDGCMSSGCYSIEQTTVIDLDYQQITGGISPEIGNLINLTLLSLESNSQLAGEIPSEIGNLTYLSELRFKYCSLTGEIPSELGNLTNLERLHFYGNEFTGEIPPELGNMTNVVYLDFHGSNLTGEIPPEIGNLNLATVSLSNNQLSGVIPPSVCNTNGIHVSDNQLCPPYPECISDSDIESQDTTNCQEVCDDDDEDGICNELDACFGINDIDGDGWLDDEDGTPMGAITKQKPKKGTKRIRQSKKEE